MPKGVYKRKVKVDHDSLTVGVIKMVLNRHHRHATPITIRRIQSVIPPQVERMLDDISSAIVAVDKVSRGRL